MDMLLRLLEESYSKKAWHGTNLRGSIRGLTAQEAARRPGRGRHNIWEIVVHCAYWKYIVWRRIVGKRRGSFPLRGSNWFARPLELSEDSWKRDISLLDRCHKDMLSALATLTPRALTSGPAGSSVNTGALLRGIASHDVYHAGQIQLIKRLVRRGR